MSARRQLIAALAEDSHGGIATLADVDHAEQLVDAHRAEVLAEAAALATPKPPEVSFFGVYGPQVAWWLRMLVGRREKATADATPATPFFLPGHTYTREHHASTIRFLVRYIDDSPEGIPYRVAFGWTTEDGDVCASPFDSDDFTGWTDVTDTTTPKDRP